MIVIAHTFHKDRSFWFKIDVIYYKEYRNINGCLAFGAISTLPEASFLSASASQVQHNPGKIHLDLLMTKLNVGLSHLNTVSFIFAPCIIDLSRFFFLSIFVTDL